jgi:hypothetical protein
MTDQMLHYSRLNLSIMLRDHCYYQNHDNNDKPNILQWLDFLKGMRTKYMELKRKNNK